MKCSSSFSNADKHQAFVRCKPWVFVSLPVQVVAFSRLSSRWDGETRPRGRFLLLLRLGARRKALGQRRHSLIISLKWSTISPLTQTLRVCGRLPQHHTHTCSFSHRLL